MVYMVPEKPEAMYKVHNRQTHLYETQKNHNDAAYRVDEEHVYYMLYRFNIERLNLMIRRKHKETIYIYGKCHM